METIEIAEKLLAEVFGGQVQLGNGDDLGGSNRTKVYRFAVLSGPKGLPQSVIVKQARTVGDVVYNPDIPEFPAWTLFNEWASLQFLDKVSDNVSFSPHFYAGDRATGLIVMEDLGTGKRLDHLLLGNDPGAAEDALVEFAAAHGRLHAITAGKKAYFEQIRNALGPSELGSGYYSYHWLAPTLDKTADVLKITPARGIDDELAILISAMQNPGPFLG